MLLIASQCDDPSIKPRINPRQSQLELHLDSLLGIGLEFARVFWLLETVPILRHNAVLFILTVPGLRYKDFLRPCPNEATLSAHMINLLYEELLAIIVTSEVVASVCLTMDLVVWQLCAYLNLGWLDPTCWREVSFITSGLKGLCSACGGGSVAASMALGRHRLTVMHYGALFL